MWDTNEFWRDYPKHPVPDNIYWLIQIEHGFYLSLLVTQFFDVRRKDFWQMFVHHVVSLSLGFLSFTCNFFRVSSFVIVLHDANDVWLELAKLGRYLNWKTWCNVFFVVFLLVWLVTRNLIFPIKLNFTSYHKKEKERIYLIWIFFVLIKSALRNYV